jgi:hypothetical protein
MSDAPSPPDGNKNKKPLAAAPKGKIVPPKGEAAKKGAAATKTPPAPKKKSNPFWFLRDEGVIDAPVANEAVEIMRRKKLTRLIEVQNYLIIFLIGALILGIPFFRPTFEHYVIRPEQKIEPLVALDMPNLTNDAVLSWVTSAITEILTVGFGDFDRQILGQRYRFTDDGWESFKVALRKENMRETFHEQQLVLTTVPGDAPVITAQGPNAKGVYTWEVELPVILTYTTNNNVKSKEKHIIGLTITRVPVEENERGIAIRNWHLGGG